MRAAVLLALFVTGASLSDLSRVYAPGTEPARGGQPGGQPEAAGLEKASVKNRDAGHDYRDDRTR